MMDTQTRATVQFAKDTDDPVAALAAFRQVLAETECHAAEDVAVAQAMFDPYRAVARLESAFKQALCLAHGLGALVERTMEAFDEDTWPDFLADERAEDLGYDPRVECECGDTLDHGSVEAAGNLDDPFGQDDPLDGKGYGGTDCEDDEFPDVDVAAERWQDMAEEAAAEARYTLMVADVDDEGHEVPGSRVTVVFL